MSATERPLAGWRILDLGIITAGAATSALLADAGADVIKIEAGSYPDPFRRWSASGRDEGRASSPVFDFTNRNKRGLALDLKSERGKALFLELARDADAVVENFRRGVMQGLGLGHDALRAVNPRMVLASISSQGETGPDRGYTSYGSTLDATGGLAAVSGYPGGTPTISGRNINYPDQLVSLFAAGAVIAAVLDARRTGQGAHIDVSQRELTASVIGEYVVAASRSTVPDDALRRGNADPGGRLQGCFRTADDRWVAVTAPGAAVERAIADALGLGPERPDAEGLARAIAGLDGGTALERLRACGAACVPVRTGREALESDETRLGHAFARIGDDWAKGFPFQRMGAPMSVERLAPAVGEDTDAVLRELLGLDDDTLARLRADGVTATTRKR